MKDCKCSICGRELLSKPTRIVQQQYFKKPYPRYINQETWDICGDCYTEILMELKRRRDEDKSNNK